MKIPFIENLAEVITQHRGILDIYVLHMHGIAQCVVVRTWPKKPKDRSGNFGKTHEAARACLAGFRSLCPNYINLSKPLFSSVAETWLDYFRSGNQSLYYAFENPPIVLCVYFGEYFQDTNTVEVFVNTKNISNLYYAWLPFKNGQPPTYPDYKKKRQGLMRCMKLFRNYTHNTGPMKPVDDNLFRGVLPVNSQLNFFDKSLTASKHTPALSLPVAYKI